MTSTHSAPRRAIPKLSNPPKAERDRIRAIVDRAVDADADFGLGTRTINRELLAGYVCDVHANTRPLDLDAMVKGRIEEVRHDVFTIRRFIDLDTAALPEQVSLHFERAP